MLHRYIDGVGLIGSGWLDWRTSIAILTGNTPYQNQQTVLPTLNIIGARDQRRLSRMSKLAFATAEQALENVSAPYDQMSTVFACSMGDVDIFNDLCLNNATENALISPTKFSYSLLNSAAGVWNISTQNHCRSVSLSANKTLVGSALLEAFSSPDTRPTLVVIYDIKTPFPLNSVLPVETDFAFALLVSPQQTVNSIATVTIAPQKTPDTPCQLPSLEALRHINPAARGLPLLVALATVQPTQLTLSPLTLRIEAC